MILNELLPIQNKNATLTMSSREIADLCEKRHELVMRDIAILNESYQKMGYPIILETPYKHPQNGQIYKHCLLTQEQVLDLISGYKHKLRIRINRRWQELESQQSPKIPQTLPEALRLAADLAEQNQSLQLENKQQSDRIESMTSYFRQGMTAPQFVKGLNGVNSTQINAFLSKKNWLYKDQRGEWRVTSYARDVYMTEEANEFIPHGCDPIIKYKPTLLKKGAAKLYEWYAKGLLPMKATWNGKFIQEKVAA